METPAEKSGMMSKMMQQQPPMMMGMQMWWNLGVMSQKLGQLLEEAGEMLDRGDLAPDTQKKLGNLLVEISKTAYQMFAPQSPEKQQQYLDQLDKFKG